MSEKMMRVIVPAIHPNWATAHANDNTPDPIIVVTMCALAVIHVPSYSYTYNTSKWNEMKRKEKK
jgi:hypothetical protein